MNPYDEIERAGARTAAGAHQVAQERVSRRLRGSVPPDPARSRRSRENQRLGAEAELEVVKLWRSAGWPVRLQPGSGGWMVDGVRVMPGDVAGAEPWGPQEVKASADLLVAGRGGGWEGQAFVRRIARQLAALAAAVVGQEVRPLLWTRAPSGQVSSRGRAWRWWSVWMPARVLAERLGVREDAQARLGMDASAWVGLPSDEFLGAVAGSPEEGGRSGVQTHHHRLAGRRPGVRDARS